MSDSDQTVEKQASNQSATADLIRAKLAHLYEDEPQAVEEVKEITVAGPHSKHQIFIDNLQKSGKSVVQVQTAWHEYYAALNNDEKREVWDEFNAHLGDTHPAIHSSHITVVATESRALAQETEVHNYISYKAKHRHHYEVQSSRERSSLPELNRHVGSKKSEATRAIKHKIVKTVSADGRLKTSHHVKSAMFAVIFAGFITGSLFFVTNNEKFIAPFIMPSKNASAAPIIADSTSVSQDPKIIIPKLNLEAPLAFGAASAEEESIQAELEKGVVLYPNTGLPGEQSNPIFFGHSSNNLFNKGSYKFVFVRLSQLEVGDTYAINYRGTQYVYKIFDRQIVRPDQVEILTEKPKPAMSTLITCDPPGTSNYRLIVRGEQISPSPTSNTASTALTEASAIREIPSNAPSLIQRLFGR